MICTYEPSDKYLSKSLPHGLVCHNTGCRDSEIPTSGYWRSDLSFGCSTKPVCVVLMLQVLDSVGTVGTQVGTQLC